VSAADGGLFGPADDNFHEVGDRWWATETCWFSFNHPERNLGGWLYALVRPNIGTCAGGAWVWDDTATTPWDVPYSINYTSLRLPVARDLRDMTLPTGVRVKVLEPLHRYELGYEDPGRLSVSLRFKAVMEPRPFAHGAPPILSASHFDQLGRVTGEIVLHGERIGIDCLSVRDRSWGPRPEHTPRRLSYCFGTATDDHGFFVTSNPKAGDDPVNHGYLLRDGKVTDVVAGRREVERDPAHGWITRARIEGRDGDGRTFAAVGETVSRMIVNRHAAITWTSLVRWTVDGATAWGEDQDMWPVHDWAAFRRAARTTAT
jgi:hypothetical protein